MPRTSLLGDAAVAIHVSIPMSTPALIPVILCGGSGTRLWPLSRETHPKQFLLLTSAYSMLQETLLRLQGFRTTAATLAPPILVSNTEHRFLVASQLQELIEAGNSELSQARIILEPQRRDTAPALTLAALAAQRDGSDPILLAMPADHAICDHAAFLQALQTGLPTAVRGSMVTFGVVPRTPEPGYGYIEHSSQPLDGGYRIVSFVEKPDTATASAYLAGGRHLWNSGLFMIRASTWLKAIGQYQNAMLRACTMAMEQAVQDLDFIRPDAQAFARSPSNSIDYAVMEHLPGDTTLGIAACVVPLDAGWSDLGTWDALWQVLPHDEAGNATRGNTLLDSCRNTLLLSSNRLVAGVGLEDILVIETPDALLVAHKDHAQNVRHIVAELKQRGQSLTNIHRKVHRPWGWYDSLDMGERFQVKRIVVNPGASLSLQMHHHRAEHWIVVKGTAEVTNGEQVLLLTENQSTYIPLGNLHRLRNPGKVPLEIIEVQSGSYLGEDDIVRFDTPSEHS